MYPQEKSVVLPVVDMVIYTIIDPASPNYENMVNEIKDIVGDKVEGEVLRYTSKKKPAVLSLKRYSAKGYHVTYTLDGSYRLMVDPVVFGQKVHVAQVDNDVFVDHLFLIETNNLLKV